MIDGNTLSDTEDDTLVVAMRASGELGPFVVSDWHADSDIGLVRGRNEDRWRGDATTGFVVADGMGGHAGGELAADRTVDHTFARLGDLSGATATRAMEAINRAVRAAGDEHGYPQLGSTVVALVVRPTQATVLSCGDSRAYRCRDGAIEMLTTDHSVRNELLASGVGIDEAEAANVRVDALTSFVGQRTSFVPKHSVASFPLSAGDRFLLCTDGISHQVDGPALAAALGLSTCRAAVERLLALAADAGGSDNATALVIDIDSERGPA